MYYNIMTEPGRACNNTDIVHYFANYSLYSVTSLIFIQHPVKTVIDVVINGDSRWLDLLNAEIFAHCLFYSLMLPVLTLQQNSIIDLRSKYSRADGSITCFYSHHVTRSQPIKTDVKVQANVNNPVPDCLSYALRFPLQLSRQALEKLLPGRQLLEKITTVSNHF